MGSIKLVVPPQSTLPSTFQHAQLPSDIGHVGHEQQVNNRFHMRADGVLHRQASRPTTPMAKQPFKVNIDLGKQGSSQEARRSRQESPLRTILTAVSKIFKRQRSQNAVAAAAEHPEMDQLRQEITALQNRCANLEEGNYSVYGSCRSSTLDILQGRRKPDAEMSQSILSFSEDSESKRTTTNVVVQPNVIPLETNNQALPTSRGLALQVPAGAEDYSEVKGVDLGIEPIMPPRTAEDGLSSPSLDQNQSAVTPATQDATPPFSQTDLQKLPRKKKEDDELDAEVMVEVDTRFDQQRLPRKKQRSEELEVETLPPRDQERLPRKGESDGGRSA